MQEEDSGILVSYACVDICVVSPCVSLVDDFLIHILLGVLLPGSRIYQYIHLYFFDIGQNYCVFIVRDICCSIEWLMIIDDVKLSVWMGIRWCEGLSSLSVLQWFMSSYAFRMSAPNSASAADASAQIILYRGCIYCPIKLYWSTWFDAIYKKMATCGASCLGIVHLEWIWMYLQYHASRKVTYICILVGGTITQ